MILSGDMGYKLGVSICLIGGTSQLYLSYRRNTHVKISIVFSLKTQQHILIQKFRFWNLRHMIIREGVEKRQEFWRRKIVQGNANDYKAVGAWEGRLEGRACKLPNSLPSSKTGHPELDCVTLTSTSMRIFQSTKLVKSSYWNCCLVLQTALITIKRELNGYNILRMWCCLHLTQASELLLVPSRDRHGWVRGSCNEFNPLTSEYRHILQKESSPLFYILQVIRANYKTREHSSDWRYLLSIAIAQ